MFHIAKVYAFFYFVIKEFVGLRLPGLGKMLRMVNSTRIVDVKGLRLFFTPEVSSEFGTHVIGKWQEPETHAFFRKIFETQNSDSGLFIDVGSNIGIFLLDVARLSDFKVVGFEPSEACIKACQKSMELNQIDNFELHNCLLGSSSKMVGFQTTGGVEGASVYNSEANENAELVKMSTLDSIESLRHDEGKHCIMLIDVEGHELEVIRGGKQFITDRSPLIIFEFNHVSRKHFTLEEILEELGSSYSLYRLRQDSFLDEKLIDTWNIVAVHSDSQYSQICNKLVVDDVQLNAN